VSWESIGKAHIANANPSLADATVPAVVVDHDARLLEQIDVIYSNDFIFVYNADRSKVTGIVTAADLTRQFGSLARPFVLIEEAENRLRRRSGEVFTVDELREAVRPPARSRVNRVADLTFGNYGYLLEPEDRWAKLSWNIDRKLFLELLEEVRKIRNELMHFTPDPLSQKQYDAVEGLLELLRTVDPRP
jgi:restriction system protein